MRFFVCVVDPEDRGIPNGVRRMYESLLCDRGLVFQWQSVGQAAVLTGWDDGYGDPLVVTAGDNLGAGVVRLDNRQDLERWAGVTSEGLTDLELVVHIVKRHGTRYVSEFLGDFAFLVWNSSSRTLVAVTDPFAVRKLYYAERHGFFAVASRAELLASQNEYDVQYLAEAVADCLPSAGLTVFAGVRQLEAGTIGVLERGRLTTHSYWSPEAFEPDPSLEHREEEVARMCRDLLLESVRLRVGDNADTWAQLSGGLDSSSIVSMAEWLRHHGAGGKGLAGTVTFVDRQGTDSDEREYSDAVVARWPHRNEKIIDPPFWLDDHYLPAQLDQPRDSLPFFPRERRLCSIVRRAGGRVLLTGFGGDELFTGTMLFFADWIVRGRVGTALNEMARWAAIGRASFWELAYRNAVLPLLPMRVRNSLLHDQGRMLPWVQPGVIRKYGLRAQVGIAAAYGGLVGRKYRHAQLTSVTAIARSLDAGFTGDVLDVRYPFVYRPLVELALRLPPALCSRPQARKWILREAMRDILPEIVRTRVGKGSASTVFASSLTAQRALLEPLVRQPILAELGVIDAAEFAKSFDAAPDRPYRGDHLHTAVHATLIIEAWLQLRSGRWPREGTLNSTRSAEQLTSPRYEGNYRRNV